MHLKFVRISHETETKKQEQKTKLGIIFILIIANVNSIISLMFWTMTIRLMLFIDKQAD